MGKIIDIMEAMTIKEWRSGLSKEDEWILSLRKDQKLKFIRELGEKNEFGMFMRLSKILLDAPISEGGVSTEEIDQAWRGE